MSSYTLALAFIYPYKIIVFDIFVIAVRAHGSGKTRINSQDIPAGINPVGVYFSCNPHWICICHGIIGQSASDPCAKCENSALASLTETGLNAKKRDEQFD
jgi:hypothetical protein